MPHWRTELFFSRVGLGSTTVRAKFQWLVFALDALCAPFLITDTGRSIMLYELFAIIKDRQAHPTEESYTARLFAGGEDAILKKVGEEAMEVILAAKGQGDQRVVEEMADLFYHSLVLLAQFGLDLDDVEEELRHRHLLKTAP